MEVRQFRSFSELVKGLRRRHKLSQRALARKLKVSPGYIGQWELELSQPSAEVAGHLCQQFEITDSEYVQRLAYAQRAPDWLRESIIRYRPAAKDSRLTPLEEQVLASLRQLAPEHQERLAERINGWVEAKIETS